MASKKQIGFLVLTFIFAAGYIFAQGENVLRLAPYTEAQQYLVEQIRADTTENGGILEGRVYELEGGAIYLNTEQFYLEAEYDITPPFFKRSKSNYLSIPKRNRR